MQSEEVVLISNILSNIKYSKEETLSLSKIYNDFESIRHVLGKYGFVDKLYSGYKFIESLDIKIIPDTDYAVLADFYASNLTEKAYSSEINVYHEKDLSSCGCKKYLNNYLEKCNVVVGLLSDAIVKSIVSNVANYSLEEKENHNLKDKTDFNNKIDVYEYIQKHAFNSRNFENDFGVVYMKHNNFYVADTVHLDIYVVEEKAQVYARFYIIPALGVTLLERQT